MADPQKFGTFPMGSTYDSLGLPAMDDQAYSQGAMPFGMINLPPATPPAAPKIPTPSTGTNADKYYQYAVLASLLGSAGAGIGQAFRPWVKPPQPLPSPQAPVMPITAPASLQYLASARAGRKGH